MKNINSPGEPHLLPREYPESKTAWMSCDDLWREASVPQQCRIAERFLQEEKVLMAVLDYGEGKFDIVIGRNVWLRFRDAALEKLVQRGEIG